MSKKATSPTFNSANDGFAAVPAIRHWEANCSSSSSIYNPNADYGDGNEQILNGGVHIINQTGAELPSTGGWDTKLTYVVGAVLAFASGLMLVVKRLIQVAEA